MNVVIAGGGTAGHVNPALALARAMDPETISFVGTADGIEASMVPAAGFELDIIDVVGFDRAHPARLPLVGARAVRALWTARRLLAQRRASVVVGMGGYVSLPVSLAAATRSIPVVLHEQNIVLGLANRVAKPGAAKVAVSFEETLKMCGAKGVYVGNPVIPEIAHLDKSRDRAAGYERFGLDPDRRTVIVFGGSLGARTLNDAAPSLAAAWSGRDDIQLLHIAGRSSDSLALEKAPDTPVYRRIGYTDVMQEAYAVADLAICRGGATTVAELTVVGLPAIIVPYPYHRDRQQERHGNVLASAGAAVVVADAEATPERLGVLCDELLDGATLARMSAAARGLGRPDAAARLAEVVRGVAV